MANLSILEKARIPNYFKSTHIRTGLVIFDPALCTGCGICVSICPAGAITMSSDTREDRKKIPELVQLFHDKNILACMACGDCTAACPGDAIQIMRGYNTKYYFKKISQVPDFAFPRKY